MKIMGHINRISDATKSRKEKQREIDASEVWHLWKHLIARYKVIEVTTLLRNFVDDIDFKLILDHGHDKLNNQVSTLEKMFREYGIPLPDKPPKDFKTPLNIEIITDKFVFRRIFRGIQAFMPTHAMALVHSPSPRIRELFMNFLVEEMDLYDKFFEYGKFKNYLGSPPVYRP